MKYEAHFSTEHLFNTDQYPIHQRSVDYFALLSQARFNLQKNSCFCLPEFIRPEIVDRMQAEVEGLSKAATFTQAEFNPYFSEPPEGLPPTHPLRRLARRSHGMVRSDQFSRADVIWIMFQNQALCDFVADALDYKVLYIYQDPFGAVNANIQPAGSEFPWHFDNNDFTVSFGLKQSKAGGVFEYVTDLRTADEPNYSAVQRVLDGDRTSVQSLVLKPGDLQLFRGGNTLHRVTAPIGEERHSLLFSYVTDPTNILSPEKATRIWGQTHPLHHKMAFSTEAAYLSNSGKPGN